MPRADTEQQRATVSVVIPVKDDAAALERCLAKLARQTRTPDEIVVVDNGSSDDSAGVAARAGARVVRCEAPGIPAASARGYDAATGELVLRLDADCEPDERWVEVVVDAFEARPDVDVLTGGARFGDGPRPLRRGLALLYLGAYTAATLPALGHRPLFGSNMAFRRAAWRSIRSDVHLDPEVHDDLDLAFHFGERHRIGRLPETGMLISMRPFADRRSFARRVRRGFRTVTVHWPHDFPSVRWLRRVRQDTAPRRAARRRAAVQR